MKLPRPTKAVNKITRPCTYDLTVINLCPPILQTNLACLHIIACNAGIMKDLHAGWLDTLEYEKIIYPFIAYRFLGLLLRIDSNHVRCLL